jgi:hypothetical protein
MGRDLRRGAQVVAVVAGASGVRVGRYCRGVPGDVGAGPVGAGSERDLQIARMNAGLMTTTVMAAVVVFLAGALLAAHSVRPDAALILLSTSALGFIVATLLYANTYAWLLDPADDARFHAQIHRANVVSECFGVYCLLLAIPVTIVSVTRNDAVRWFVAAVTLLAIVGYQLSGASLLSHYLAQHTSRWRRAVISLIGVAFTALLVGLGVWLFVAEVSGSDARLVPAFVIVGFLTLAGAYAIWAEPLQSRAGPAAAPAPSPADAPAPPPVTPATSAAPQPARARPLRAWPAATITGPAAQPGLPTNAPPWAVAQAARQERLEQDQATAVELVASGAHLAARDRDARARGGHPARPAQRQRADARERQAGAVGRPVVDRRARGPELQAQRDQSAAARAAAVTTGELTAKVFVTRIRQALIGLLAVIRSNRQLRPAIPISDLNVSVPSGVSMLRTSSTTTS